MTPALPLPPLAHELPIPAAHPGPGGTRLIPGVPYAAIPGIRPLELDLVLPPEGDGPVPVVVFLHGGGWRLGSRHGAGPMYRGADPTPFEQIAQAGIAVASVDHGLSGADLGIDPDRIAAWGESAGGHPAALLGLTGDDAGLEGDVGNVGTTSRVSAVVAWYAPSDVAAVAAVATDTGADPADPTTRENQLLGAPAPSVPEIAAQASPIILVSPDAPPFLLLHGAADRFVPCVQSERLYSALVEAGVDVELDVYADADHMWLGSPDAAHQALGRTTDVLHHRLGPRGRP